MVVGVVAAAEGLRAALAGFDPAVLSGAECGRVAEVLAVTEKACTAVRLLAVARAAQAGVHEVEGFKDGVSWLAARSGVTGAQARQALETVSRLEGCPDTRAAVMSGEISVSQAGEIVDAEADTPGAEAVLLPVARRCDLTRLRERSREHRQANIDVEALHGEQLAAREWRTWRDRLGMVRFAGALPPEVGLPVARRVELAAVRARRQARADGREAERFEAYAADAVAGLVLGGGGGRARSDRAELVLVCDLFAYRRGHTHPGEVCHIVDGGPVPVDVARDFADDAFVKTALHDGTAIQVVSHPGRTMAAALRTALDLGPVPQFTGRACARCGSRWGLQYDHADPVANHGPTAYDNIQALCWKDHQNKTEHDRQTGLLGPHPPPSTPRRTKPQPDTS